MLWYLDAHRLSLCRLRLVSSRRTRLATAPAAALSRPARLGSPHARRSLCALLCVYGVFEVFSFVLYQFKMRTPRARGAGGGVIYKPAPD